jgi:hypothetical protein
MQRVEHHIGKWRQPIYEIPICHLVIEIIDAIDHFHKNGPKGRINFI